MSAIGDDQVIDADAARALHSDACRAYPLVEWVVSWDEPAYPDRYTARLVTTKSPLPYVLVADTLAGVEEQLPPGLAWFERQPVHPPEVVELWFAV